MDQSRLTCCISNTATTRSYSGKRRNVDDAAHFVTSKLRCERPCEHERPTNVRLVNTIPNAAVSESSAGNGMPMFHAALFDEDIDPPETTDHLVDAGIDRFRIALVKLHGEALSA